MPHIVPCSVCCDLCSNVILLLVQVLAGGFMHGEPDPLPDSIEPIRSWSLTRADPGRFGRQDLYLQLILQDLPTLVNLAATAPEKEGFAALVDIASPAVVRAVRAASSEPPAHHPAIITAGRVVRQLELVPAPDQAKTPGSICLRVLTTADTQRRLLQTFLPACTHITDIRKRASPEVTAFEMEDDCLIPSRKSGAEAEQAVILEIRLPLDR